MLPTQHRLHRATDFREVLRRGRRASRPLLIVHVLLEPDPVTDVGTDVPARAGLVVSKAVGGSVARHRTARRLRHLLRAHLSELPPGSRIVVRASAGAGEADSAALEGDFAPALAAALRPRGPRR